jgi:hypothetical protein
MTGERIGLIRIGRSSNKATGRGRRTYLDFRSLPRLLFRVVSLKLAFLGGDGLPVLVGGDLRRSNAVLHLLSFGLEQEETSRKSA